MLKKKNMVYFINYLLTHFNESSYEDSVISGSNDSMESEELYDYDKAEEDAIKEHQPVEQRLKNAETMSTHLNK